MKDYVKKYEAQGKKCLFIGALGDNFYNAGVIDENHWAEQWSNVYGTNNKDSPLYQIPWLSVLGNHDLGNDDPECLCSGNCKQFNNASGRPASINSAMYWMPYFYWHYSFKEIGLEILGMETNAIDVASITCSCNPGCSWAWPSNLCNHCGGFAAASAASNEMYSTALEYLDERAEKQTPPQPL